ncbi:hypothetical protein QYF50_00070 [Paenibacillus vini]|uniref:hypothetical protein n=1 Tax=Paenibacillus vini TaxID=1476024 RepID=UPI0025B6D101|nr:hypothetical protein [Paenibacillus vini]MDN4066269.1 hypothetical protein [Paenibacillus vini]
MLHILSIIYKVGPENVKAAWSEVTAKLKNYFAVTSGGHYWETFPDCIRNTKY